MKEEVLYTAGTIASIEPLKTITIKDTGKVATVQAIWLERPSQGQPIKIQFKNERLVGLDKLKPGEQVKVGFVIRASKTEQGYWNNLHGVSITAIPNHS